MGSGFNPLVSIVIPVYNGSNYMREAIDSALAQTYKNIEILVVNDGSNDEGKTKDIALSYGNRIRYFEKENGGASTALNLGIKKMKGEYFSWLSHDDLYDKDKIEKQIEYLKGNSLLGTKTIVFSDFATIDKTGKIIRLIKIDYKEIKNNSKYALLRHYINGLSLLIPKQAFMDYGGFDTELKCTQDYEKWLDFMNSYNFVHVKGIYVSTRMHAKQMGKTSTSVNEEEENLYLRIIKSFTKKERCELENSEYEFYYKMIEYLYALNYEKVLNYCKNELKDFEPKQIKTKNVLLIDYKKGSLKKLYEFLKTEGIFFTVKRVLIYFYKRIYLLYLKYKTATEKQHN